MNDLQAQLAQLDLQKCIAIGLAIAAFYYVVVFDHGTKLEGRVQSARQEITKSQATLAKVKRALEDQKKFQEDIKGITSNMKDFQKFFASDMSMNELQSNVSKFAEQSKLVVNKLKPKNKDSEFPNYQETAVEFEIEGNFHNIMEFISLLTRMERAIDFDSMEFKTVVGGDYPVIKLTTVLVVYSSTENADENRGA